MEQADSIAKSTKPRALRQQPALRKTVRTVESNLFYVQGNILLHHNICWIFQVLYYCSQLTFDAVTSDRLSNFIKSVLDTFGILLEVGTFHDVGKHSDELLNYLRWVIIIEPISCLYSVQQVSYVIYFTMTSLVLFKLLLRSFWSLCLGQIWHLLG